jgi:hypothetical protein
MLLDFTESLGAKGNMKNATNYSNYSKKAIMKLPVINFIYSSPEAARQYNEIEIRYM